MKLNRRQLRRLIETTISMQERRDKRKSKRRRGVPVEKITITYQAKTDTYVVPANSEKVFHVYIKDNTDGIYASDRDDNGNKISYNTSKIGFILNDKLYVTKGDGRNRRFNILYSDGYEIKTGNEPNELIIKNHGSEDFKFALASNDGP